MRSRLRMGRHHSRRSFRRGMSHHRRNHTRVYRGGIRL